MQVIIAGYVDRALMANANYDDPAKTILASASFDKTQPVFACPSLPPVKHSPGWGLTDLPDGTWSHITVYGMRLPGNITSPGDTWYDIKTGASTTNVNSNYAVGAKVGQLSLTAGILADSRQQPYITDSRQQPYITGKENNQSGIFFGRENWSDGVIHLRHQNRANVYFPDGRAAAQAEPQIRIWRCSSTSGFFAYP